MPTRGGTVPVSRLRRLTNFEKLIGANVVQSLTNVRGPHNVDLGGRCLSQPEMQSLVARGKITTSCRDETSLAIDSHARAETVAIAADPTQRNRQPMLFS